MERAAKLRATNLDTRAKGAPSAPNLLTRLRFGPDAAARAVVVAVALILTWHTWAQWGDLQIDCGRELYVPIEILRGKLLYRDVWYQYGPLTPYVQVLLIEIFGQHLSAFYWFGIVIATGCALLLYQIGTMLEGRGAGLLAAAALLFRAFYPTQADYPLPYTYAASLGLLSGLVCAWFMVNYLIDRTPRRLLFAGVAAGFALLCKPEIGGACYVALAFAIGMEGLLQRSALTIFRRGIECLPGVLVPLIGYGWFLGKLGLSFVLFHNVEAIPGSHFMASYGATYNAAVGMRFVPAELAFLTLTGLAALPAWILIVRGLRLERGRVKGWTLLIWVIVLVAAVASARYSAAQGQVGYLFSAMMLVFPPGMYFIGCGFLLYSLYQCFGRGRRGALAEAAFTVFALALAIRVMVEVIAYTYPVFYVPPLVLIFAIVLSRCLYAASSGMTEERRWELVNVLLAVETVLLAIIFVPGRSGRTAPFETSWGTMYLTPRDAAAAREMLDFISAQRRLSHRVVLLPELTFFYVFTKSEAPSRWYVFVPGILTSIEQASYIATLGRVAPDYIILANEKTGGYGKPYFGLNYDQELYSWIERNYRVVRQFGEFQREQNAPLAALLYQRRKQPKTVSSVTRTQAQRWAVGTEGKRCGLRRNV